MTKRVLHISTPESWRGGEQQLAYLIQYGSANFQQNVLCPKKAVIREKLKGQTLNFFDFRAKSLPKRIAQCIRVFKELQPQIIHTHDSKAHTIALLALVLTGKKIPLVVARRVDFPIGKNALSTWKYEHPRVSKIVCVSVAIKKICAKELRRNQSKLTTIHSGVEAKERMDADAKQKMRASLGFDSSDFLVGCVAALAPHKNHEILLRAWKEFL
ncbi:MAG: glycosyltransferase, partial [Luteibaculum sp.]